MKVEKEVAMDYEEVNSELQILAQEAVDEVIDLQYNQMMDELYQQWELEQYASDCYDLDAEYYGEM